ncbi:MAG: phosphatase PAP2 family protein [Clostridia bacterium]
MIQFIQSIDFQILEFLRLIPKSDIMNNIMVFFTTLGDTGLLWIIGCFILMCFKKYRKIGIFCLIAISINFVIVSGILKPLISRDRPFFYFPEMQLLINKPTDYSFPSGHASIAFAAFSYLFSTKLKRFWIPALVVAIIISFSRLYLYVHFPSDVLVGALIGLLSGFISFLIYKQYIKNSEKLSAN